MKADSLATKAYFQIRKQILSNQLMPGSRLKEDEWAKRIGVNRMAVREALMRLLGEKMVVSGERGGYFVKCMTVGDVQEIRELRELLEIGALRLAVHKINDHHIKKLLKICDDFTSMVQGEYFNGACEADVKFHETLIACSDNKKLMEIYQLSNIPLFHHKLGKVQVDIQDYEITDAEHREVVKALSRKNLKFAEDTLTKHLLRGEMIVLDKFPQSAQSRI